MAEEQYTLVDGDADKLSLVATVLQFLDGIGIEITDQRIHEELQNFDLDSEENFTKIRTFLESEA